MKILTLSLIAISPLTLFAGEHFDRAQELYKQGPSKAPETVAELDLELREHPDDIKAYLLKAIVQIGTNGTQAALKTLGQAELQDSSTKTIHREIYYLRARCFCQRGDFAAAKKALEPFSAFFIQDPQSEARYDQLMAAIAEGLNKNAFPRETLPQGKSAAPDQAMDSFQLVKVATDVVQQNRRETLAGFMGIFVDRSHWTALSSDSDLRPFLKFKESDPDITTVIIVPPHPREGTTYCVYFRGKVPVGFVGSEAKRNGKRTEDDIKDSYRPIGDALVKPGGEELVFTKVSLVADDGSPFDALKILSGGKSSTN